MQSFKDTDKKYVAATYARFDIEIVAGKGSLLYGADGREYIDLNSGIAVNTLGAADEEWIAAATAQMRKIQHTSNLFYSQPCARLARTLAERTGASRAFFSNSGAEANECAVKCARLWAEKNKGAEYCNIITLKNGFHGRTLATLAATGQEVFHQKFAPLPAGFLYAEAGDAAGLAALAEGHKCAAVMLEFVQGEGGVVPLGKDYVQQVADLCRKYDLLLIADEVQTGNGRTGTLYAFEQYGVVPDILTTAKGLAGGLPLGATLFFGKTADVLGAGDHGSTFGGNPVCCAAALSVLGKIDEKLLCGVRRKSEAIRASLCGAAGIRGVSGLGLMLGIETEAPAAAVIENCMKRGVLPIRAKNKVRLLPALNIPDELLERAAEIIKISAKEALK